MTEFKRPMLAATADPDNIKLPALMSPKLDGIRCIVIDGVAMSRSMKPIPNRFVQLIIGRPEYNGLDGELIVGPPNSPSVYRDTNSGVMSRDGEPDFKFFVFDRIDMGDAPFADRISEVSKVDLPRVQVVEHHLVILQSEVDLNEADWLAQGYEGAMLRSLEGTYKQGRSTLKEGGLLKLKRFVDSEYEVVGFEERMHNANVATTNELGYTERSSHKENMVGRGDLGALVLKFGDR